MSGYTKTVTTMLATRSRLGPALLHRRRLRQRYDISVDERVQTNI